VSEYAILRTAREQVELAEVEPPREPQAAYQDLLRKRTETLTVCFDWAGIE
jgi:hypothetical protein